MKRKMALIILKQTSLPFFMYLYFAGEGVVSIFDALDHDMMLCAGGEL